MLRVQPLVPNQNSHFRNTGNAFLNLFIFFTLLILSIGCDSRVGILTDTDGNPVAQTPVRLITIDNQGNETGLLTTAVTDEKGEFFFKELYDNTNASTVLEASPPGGTLRGYLAGRNDTVPIHPLTHALVSLIVDITLPSEGRDFEDFLGKELRNIGESIFSLDISSLDLTDSNALKNFLRSNVGRQIAQAAGGTISAVTTSAFQGTGTAGTVTFQPVTGLCSGTNLFILSSSNFQFDLEEDGSLCGKTSSTLTNMFNEGSVQLVLPGEDFLVSGGEEFNPVAPGPVEIIDDREVTLGPLDLKKPNVDPPEADDITVSRKIFVPQSGDWIRYLEVISNSGTSDRTISELEVRSFLNTGNDSALLSYDSDGTSPTLTERHFSVYDSLQDRPTAGFVIQDQLSSLNTTKLNIPGLAGGQSNEVTFGWSNLTIPANSTRTFVHYIFLTTSRSETELDNELSKILRNPNMSGMSLEELAGLLNFTPNAGTITGEAGSVVGQATVTATNTRSNQSVSVKARSDGSFSIPIDTQNGDSVQITSSDGLDTTITLDSNSVL